MEKLKAKLVPRDALISELITARKATRSGYTDVGILSGDKIR